MSEAELAFCVPTYNRAAYLDACLENLVSQARKFQIPIYISDNASTDDTSLVVAKYQAIYPLISYEKNNDNIGPDRNFEKVLKMSSTAYAWLCSDDDRLAPEAVEEVMKIIQARQPAMIVVNGGRKERRGINGRVKTLAAGELTDRNELLAKLGWHMTWLSCLIFSRQLISQGNFARYYQTNFLQFSVVFDYLARAVEPVYYVAKPLVNNANFSVPAWYQEAFAIFGRKWHDQVMALPEVYSQTAKKACIKVHGVKSRLFGFKGLIISKLLGYYNYSIYAEYSRYFAMISDLPKWFFFLLAVIPLPPFVAKIFKANYERLYKMMLRLV
ncbi:hypothetical protein A2311_05210 [candidate division WOR-1 bacterium RIFOXYB2_FULL_48_7]|uniref:Glycosyltransferase 2-like domain-containing protein n=1 Tax=candidate division WOR-1 bacterium RIFOXYB2_FULL_48_7 TaxID=1802583 RepID=A0A1F4TJW5_UNCSA|nr:MAG: hypothetical protein A2311_05210 [candidate division WOR-1 bacterium RIFOXYB2_FULL_48_7]